ncbi:MAG: DUF1206 domain-containing protein [Microbacterium sp.]|nr:DUF1206 domain-containing protein [Microbacterium sp.]
MSTAKQAARAAKGSTTFRRVARAGFVVLGLVHIVIGAIAISVAGGAGGDADQDGAMAQVRSTPIGGLLLLLIAIGLGALAAWQVISALLVADPEETRKWARRLKAIGITLAYLTVATMALVYAVGGSADSERTSQTLSARVMAAPGGVFLLVLIGAAVVAVGVGFIVGGLTRGFEKTIDVPRGPAGAGIRALGVVGYLAKGVAVGATGSLFLIAALTQDPQKAAGLDAALHGIAQLPWGRAMLWAVAAGLIVYGVFCVARARYARM